MRRWLIRVGIGVAVLLCVLGLAVWYLSELPWHNRCADSEAPEKPGNSAVATSQALATKAAAEVLQEGGSAADAAVAAALMLAVVEPGNSGLGGGGFALVHDPVSNGNVALDFREHAPLELDVAAVKSAVKKSPDALRNGALSVAVPAEWQGLVELHRRFGRLPLTRLARPAIAAARAGVAVGRDYSARCWVRLVTLRGETEARRIFMKSSGLCPFPGWTLRQPELADTLSALTDATHPRSWSDVVGRRMVAFLNQKGSKISARDLDVPSVVERPVVSGHFHGLTIVSLAPPSSGGILVIGMLQAYEHMRQRLPQANWLHLWTEASRLAFRDRANLLGDPDFVTVPVDRLISDDYATQQAARVSDTKPLDLPRDAPAREGAHTTHLSVIDKSGLAVSATLTINVPFGSGLVVPGTGVLLNDEMDDFYVQGPNAFGLVGNDLNAPAPGKKPLSSISPTFVFDDHGLSMVLGSPGGSTIPTAVAWVIRGVVEGHLSAGEAVRAPRVHDQWVPDELQVEPSFDRKSLPPDLAAHVAKAHFPIGRVQMVMRDAAGWHAVSDCRDDGEGWSGTL